jgi:hypothetical protein
MGHGLPLLSELGDLWNLGQLHRAIYEQARIAAGRAASPSVVIMDGQSVKTTERGGTRGFDGYKCVKGCQRHILVDTLGLPIASRVEPANVSDRRAGARLLGGLSPLFPTRADPYCQCRSREPKAGPSTVAGRRLEVADRERPTASLQDHRAHVDCGAELRLAPIVGSARITSNGCSRPSAARHCRDPAHPQPLAPA